nr:hypothetical protein [Candidatus Woesearchaeota archaeon]
MDKGTESAQKKPFSKRSFEEYFIGEPRLSNVLANNCLLVAYGLSEVDRKTSAERIGEILEVERFDITTRKKEGNIDEIFLTYEGLPFWQKVAELPSYARVIIVNDFIKYVTIH